MEAIGCLGSFPVVGCRHVVLFYGLAGFIAGLHVHCPRLARATRPAVAPTSLPLTAVRENLASWPATSWPYHSTIPPSLLR